MPEVQDAEYTIEGEGQGQGTPGMAVAAPRARAPARETFTGMLLPVAQPAQIMEAQEAARELIVKVLKLDWDYGLIKGTRKPCCRLSDFGQVCLLLC